MFPLNRIADIQQNPSEFKLLEMLPAKHWTLPITLNQPNDGEVIKVAVVDIESTGLDVNQDEVIEFGCVTATINLKHGLVCTVEHMVSLFNEPKEPISALITDITGITDDDVKGHKLTIEQIYTAFDGVELVIAHNAGFDRPMLDAHVARLGYPALSLPWACSINDIPWRDLGRESKALSYLLNQQGYFFDGHRAGEDALATINLLALEPRALSHLITAYKTPSYDLRVTSRFEAKDQLKSMRCQWDPENTQWHKLVSGDDDVINEAIVELKTADMPGLISVSPELISPVTRYANA